MKLLTHAKSTDTIAFEKALLIIEKLLCCLPDANNGEDWNWCWDELFDSSQEMVKQARKQARKFLLSVKPKGEDHDIDTLWHGYQNGTQ